MGWVSVAKPDVGAIAIEIAIGFDMTLGHEKPDVYRLSIDYVA